MLIKNIMAKNIYSHYIFSDLDHSSSAEVREAQVAILVVMGMDQKCWLHTQMLHHYPTQITCNIKKRIHR